MSSIFLAPTDLSKPLPPETADVAVAEMAKKVEEFQRKRQDAQKSGKRLDASELSEFASLRTQLAASTRAQKDREDQRFQEDWAERVLRNGKATGVYADYHYFGTGDVGGAPDEQTVKRLEAIITKGAQHSPSQEIPVSEVNPKP